MERTSLRAMVAAMAVGAVGLVVGYVLSGFVVGPGVLAVVIGCLLGITLLVFVLRRVPPHGA